VRATPAQVDAAEQAENELTYFRAIGDRASAVTAAENALKLSPADPAKALDYGRALLDAGRAEEALAIGQKALDQLPSGKGEPPGAFVRLVRDARAQVIAKAMANEKPGT
jgi:tetratricopeptide (TPR) repeat protein